MDFFNTSKTDAGLGATAQRAAQRDAEKLKEQNSFNDLLKLQLKAMNPNPMQEQDPGAMMQMATNFTSMMTGQKVLAALDSIEGRLIEIENSIMVNQSAGFISDDLVKFSGSDVTCEFYIDENAKIASAKFRILDKDNKVLYEEGIKNPKSGHSSFVWNGKTSDGKTLDNGTYKFDVLAVDGEGKAIRVEKYSRTTEKGEKVFGKA